MTDTAPPIIDGQREARCAPLAGVEVRANDDGSRTLTGYASVFDSPSEDLGGFTEVIARGSFRKVLRSQPDVRFLVNHEGIPLARSTAGTLRLEEDSRGLRIEADLPDTQQGRDLTTSIERGDVSQMSFAFMIDSEGREWDFPEDGLARRTIFEIRELLDVSAVTYPAYPATEIGVRGVVAGEPIATSDGHLDAELLAGVCERVHSGALSITAAERRDLERAADQLDTLTPWRNSAPLGSDKEQPAEGSDDAATEGEPYGLAARSRRFQRLEAEAPKSVVTGTDAR